MQVHQGDLPRLPPSCIASLACVCMMAACPLLYDEKEMTWSAIHSNQNFSRFRFHKGHANGEKVKAAVRSFTSLQMFHTHTFHYITFHCIALHYIHTCITRHNIHYIYMYTYLCIAFAFTFTCTIAGACQCTFTCTRYTYIYTLYTLHEIYNRYICSVCAWCVLSYLILSFLIYLLLPVLSHLFQGMCRDNPPKGTDMRHWYGRACLFIIEVS